MILQLIGCSHHDCSVELLEQMAISEGQIPVTLAQFQDRFPEVEAVLLSTCNRTEFYTAATDPQQAPSARDVTTFLAEARGLKGEKIFNELFRHTGEDAVRHLFMVASSLDSMVVGEAQILSQVKQAYRLAAEGNSAGQLTHAAFQAAIRAAKRVAAETAIHRKRVSIPSIAIGDFARQIFERLDDKSVLIVGAGEMGQESVRYLLEEDAPNLTIINRNPARAAELVRRFGGQTAHWDQLDDLLAAADLVISTTGSDQPIMTSDRFRSIETRRFQRPLFIVDLAVPRDFDPLIGQFVGVYLYSLDDLSEACEANRRARDQEWPKARRIITEETRRFMSELQHRATGPTIRRLKDSAEKIRHAELQRLLNKLEGIDQRSRQEIEHAFQRLVNKMLHPPLESLKEEAKGRDHAHLLDALKRLFRLKD